MKLAEALIRRADLQKRKEYLKQRLDGNLVIQEGTEPAEDPKILLAEFREIQEELKAYIQRINRTNQAALFDETRSLADVICERDLLLDERNLLAHAVKIASNLSTRYSNKEIRNVSTLDVVSLQKKVDKLSKAYRELDIALQGKNWTIDLLD